MIGSKATRGISRLIRARTYLSMRSPEGSAYSWKLPALRSAALAVALGAVALGPSTAQTQPTAIQPGDAEIPTAAEQHATDTPAADTPGAIPSPVINPGGPAPKGYTNVGGTNLPTLSLHAGEISGTASDYNMATKNGIPVMLEYGGVLHIQAGKLHADRNEQLFEATDGVSLIATDTSIASETLNVHVEPVTLDPAKSGKSAHDRIIHAQITKGVVKQRPYIIRAEDIEAVLPELQPGGYLASPGAKLPSKTVSFKSVGFTTETNGRPAGFEIRAREIDLNLDKKSGVARGAALYLFGTRVLEIPHIRFVASAHANGTARRSVIPVIGASHRYGIFTEFQEPVGPVSVYALIPQRQSMQLRASTVQHLIVPRPVKRADSAPPDPTDYVGLIRSYTSIARPTLPYGDPLLFHSFLPESDPWKLFASRGRARLDLREEVSAHIATSGNSRDDLYVSRQPELSLIGSMPLTPVLAVPTGGDPVSFRRYLRRPTIYAGSSFSFGQYYEEPTKIRHSRTHFDVSSWTTPLLVAKNTIIIPRARYSVNHYGDSHSDYRYWQASALGTHFFSDRASIGAEYLVSSVSGRSPFNFDVLDTANEFDIRGQVGDHHFALAGLAKYDIDRKKLFDYLITVAPNVRGLVPEISYHYRSQSIELGLEVEGVSF